MGLRIFTRSCTLRALSRAAMRSYILPRLGPSDISRRNDNAMLFLSGASARHLAELVRVLEADPDLAGSLAVPEGVGDDARVAADGRGGWCWV